MAQCCNYNLRPVVQSVSLTVYVCCGNTHLPGVFVGSNSFDGLKVPSFIATAEVPLSKSPDLNRSS